MNDLTHMTKIEQIGAFIGGLLLIFFGFLIFISGLSQQKRNQIIILCSTGCIMIGVGSYLINMQQKSYNNK